MRKRSHPNRAHRWQLLEFHIDPRLRDIHHGDADPRALLGNHRHGGPTDITSADAAYYRKTARIVSHSSASWPRATPIPPPKKPARVPPSRLYARVASRVNSSNDHSRHRTFRDRLRHGA